MLLIYCSEELSQLIDAINIKKKKKILFLSAIFFDGELLITTAHNLVVERFFSVFFTI